MALSWLVILARRAFSNPTPGVVIYSPVFDPIALLAIVGFIGVVGVAAASSREPSDAAIRLSPC